MDGSVEAQRSSPEDKRVLAKKLALMGRTAETRGALRDSLEKLEAALAYLPESEPSTLRADVLLWLGTTLRELGQTGGAKALYEESEKLARDLEYVGGEGYAINGLASIAQRRGDLAKAQFLYRKAARRAFDARDLRLAGVIEQNLGKLAIIRGDFDGALVRLRASLGVFEKDDFQQGMSWALNNLGMLHSDLGEFADAEVYLRRGLEIASRGKDLHARTLLESNLTEVYIGLKEWSTARDYVKNALSLAEKRGDPLGRAGGLKLLSIIQRAQGELPLAEESLAAAKALADESEDVLLTAEIARELGETQALMGEVAKAKEWLERSVELFRGMDAGLDAAIVQGRLEQIETEPPSSSESTASAGSTVRAGR
jgi:tetratricopeptide (TPR) repeat protein